jgi:outer membrane lipopolysaccharide assembly protein LptE/RlpB
MNPNRISPRDMAARRQAMEEEAQARWTIRLKAQEPRQAPQPVEVTPSYRPNPNAALARSIAARRA